ncbi:MAG: class I SAM-dependent methyltransferase, partial [Actinomycetota bacterium]|nr:class I SAM-dependent methyltransferase [Actinomycetota bacterium]
LIEAAQLPVRTVLELGSGGGNNASHLKAHFDLTLVDLSEDMLALSRSINPECEHVPGDMRSVRLQREFDAVFLHDALDYMTTVDDLRSAIETSYVHCKKGGAALFAPDHVRETLVAKTDHGGHDGEERSLRYLEWTWDPDPDDDTYVADYAFLLRDANGRVSVEHDRHTLGAFPRATWMSLIEETGFRAEARPGIEDETAEEVFIGVKVKRPSR